MSDNEISTQKLRNSISRLRTKQLVELLEFTAGMLDIDTPSNTARTHNKTYSGIMISNRYKKIRIGKTIMVVSGIRNDGKAEK